MSTPIYPLVDRILDGKLAETLADRRAQGDSFETIAQWFGQEHGIAVTAETVRRWVLANEAEPTEAAS